MKTHTQQQTKLKLKKAASEQTYSSQKRSEYRPRKSRGNTLVPVIIALAISALATIAFLDQGANLQEDTKVVAAQNEIIALLQDYDVAKQMNGGTVPTVVFVSGNNKAYNALQSYAPPVSGATTGTITFTTDTDSACASLAGKVPTSGNNVSGAPTCAQNVLSISLQ
jgi:hypothetical protein